MSVFARAGLRSAQVARFSTAAPLRKSVTDSVKDGVKKVDRTVSDAAVAGIDAGSKAAGKVKEAAGVTSGEAEGKVNELSGKAKGTAHEAAGKVKGAAEQAKGKLS